MAVKADAATIPPTAGRHTAFAKALGNPHFGEDPRAVSD
jgi:hypothetical protein